ncbi:MAG TPA: hypothetical protein VIL07_10950 [Symbiobacteriaceae bacterium]
MSDSGKADKPAKSVVCGTVAVAMVVKGVAHLPERQTDIVTVLPITT